jgi:hypothetical protein
MKFFKLVIITLSLLAGGCMFREISAKDLTGRYRADLPEGAVEFLELLPHGECVQEIRLRNGVAYSARGRWSYNPTTRYLTLQGTREALTPTEEINPNLDTIPGGFTGSLPVFRSVSSEIVIMFSEYRNYRKLK